MTESIPHEKVGTLYAIVIDVNDLETCAKFWSQDLGGHKLKQFSEYGIKWVVMADPDGNEFCLVKHSK